jgi:adenylate kinase
VIYLTGAPATGKSTLATALRASVSPLRLFSYSEELVRHVASRDENPLSQFDLRQRSSAVVTPEDVDTVDDLLVQFVQTNREECHIVIDSHAVTRETYGYRATPFSLTRLHAISPSVVYILFAESQVVIDRISTNSRGRSLPSPFEADFHANLQCSLALSYATMCGIPAYFLDGSRSTEHLCKIVFKNLQLDSPSTIWKLDQS